MDMITIRMISQKMNLNGSILMMMVLEIMRIQMTIMILGPTCGKVCVIQIPSLIPVFQMISIQT